MKTPINTKPAVKKRKIPPLATIVGLVVVAGLVWGSIALFGAFNMKPTVNYAEEVARPLEEAMIRSGATKVCTQGDAGRSADNPRPGYDVVFETGLSKDEAIKQIVNLAKDNGYNLTYNRSPTEHLDKYADGTSKNSPYPELLDGKIKLFVDFYSGGSSLGCPGKTVEYDANHTAVGLTVSLPEFRR